MSNEIQNGTMFTGYPHGYAQYVNDSDEITTMYWYRDDLDVFTMRDTGETWTRIGPVVTAHTDADAMRQFMKASLQCETQSL